MKKVKVICFLMVVLVLSGCTATESGTRTIAEPLSDEQLETRNLTEQIFDYSDENLLAFKDIDNNTVMYMFSAPIEKSKNTIVADKKGYKSKGDYFNKYFPNIFSEKNGIKIDGLGNEIEILSNDQNSYTSELIETKNVFGQKRDAVIYKDMFGKGVDFRCYSTTFGVNTEIVITKKTSQNSFKLKLKLESSFPDSTSEDYILLKDALNNSYIKSIIHTPLAVDKKGNWNYENTVRIIDKDSKTNTYTIEYAINQEFLENNKISYPITLNQSVYLYKTGQPDTPVYEKADDTSGFYLSPYMVLGDSTKKSNGWSYIRYETLENIDISAEKIISAKYVFRNLFDLPKQAKISAYAVTADWCSINTRWFNRPAFDEKPVSEVIVKNSGDYELDITPLLKQMMENKGNELAIYSIRNSFFIRSDTEEVNVLLAAGDMGLFSPLLEIKVAN